MLRGHGAMNSAGLARTVCIVEVLEAFLGSWIVAVLVWVDFKGLPVTSNDEPHV